jgi:phage tail sheath protein FI
MAETLLSPGVFASENDQTQITQGPVQAGAAIIGPTVVGPVNIPTLVTSYSQYKAIFGAAFVSGGLSQEYLTSIAVNNYFNQGGSSMLVTRVASGSYTAASANLPSIATATSGGFASGSINLTVLSAPGSGSVVINGTTFLVSGSTGLPTNTTTTVYVPTGSSLAGTMGNLTASINSAASQSYYGYGIVATGIATSTLSVSASIGGTAGNYYTLVSGSTTVYLGGGTDLASFTIGTLSVGSLMNNNQGTAAPTSIVNGVLTSGSSSNIRWEVTSVNTGSGTFSIVVRRGDDYQNSRTVLESWNNLSLDPNQNNYIEYVIGNQTRQVITDPTTGNSYVQTTGTYANKSRYIYISSVTTPTINYFNSAGTVSNAAFPTYLPQLGSGSAQGTFSGALGAIYGSYGVEALKMFKDIPTIPSTTATPNSNIQGIHASDYDLAISLLGNADDYKFNVVYAPGITSQNAPSEVNSLMTLAQNRGDNIAVVDLVGFGANLGTVTTAAQNFDNNYAATYWPWLQISSPETGKINYVPASTLIPAVYEYNDLVGAEWFAPAGFTRGGLGTVLQPERKLSVDDRNTLYLAKVNPIATFPGVGTVVYGQKTLQAKSSALDRVNVRRLLIALKSYIKQIADNLVFEPNTQVTRNKFLNAVRPYLSTVQQKQGLYAFNVVMDETNNTPDVIDRNELVGSVYLQPTRTSEYVYITFNLTPTGTSFS